MKIQTANKGFTALELVIVIAIIAVIAVVTVMLLPKIRNESVNRHITCFNNLRSLSIGFRLFSEDGAPYPQYHETNAAWNYFQTVGRELGSPKILLCPEDHARRKAALDFVEPPTIESSLLNFDAESTKFSFSNPDFQNEALSYFYGADSSEDKSKMFLAGDRSLSTNTTMLSGLLSLKTDTKAQWAPGIHKDSGNIVFADGSAQRLTTAQLLTLVQTGTNGTQRLLIP